MNNRLFAGGKTRTFITVEDIESPKRAMKPMTLVAQPNPIWGSSFVKMIGYNTPATSCQHFPPIFLPSTGGLPKLLPLVAIPVASAFLVVKYVGKILTPGTKTNPAPIPMQNPCANMICQYSVAMLVIMTPNTIMNDPSATRCRKYPASKSGPVAALTRRRRKPWIEPIQDMSEGDWEDRMAIS
jgi:hypothetical protein